MERPVMTWKCSLVSLTLLMMAVVPVSEATDLDMDDLARLSKYSKRQFKKSFDAIEDYVTAAGQSYIEGISTNETMSSLVTGLEKTLRTVDQSLDRLNKRLRPYALQFTEETDVNAFQARMTESPENQEAGTALEFDIEDNDFGFRLMNDEGYFTAESDGPHLFIVKVTTVNFEPVHLVLTRNDLPAGYISGGGHTVSNMFLLELVKDDIVKVVIKEPGGPIETNYETMFLGFTI